MHITIRTYALPHHKSVWVEQALAAIIKNDKLVVSAFPQGDGLRALVGASEAELRATFAISDDRRPWEAP